MRTTNDATGRIAPAQAGAGDGVPARAEHRDNTVWDGRERRMSRIVRLKLRPGDMPLLDAMNMAVPSRRLPACVRGTAPAPQRPVVWQATQGIPPRALTSDRNHLAALMVLMVVVWSVVIFAIVYKGITPPSGFDLRWSDR